MDLTFQFGWRVLLQSTYIYCLTTFYFIGNNNSTDITQIFLANYRRYLYTTQNQIFFVVLMLEYFVNFICTYFMLELNRLAYLDLTSFNKIQCSDFLHLSDYTKGFVPLCMNNSVQLFASKFNL